MVLKVRNLTPRSDELQGRRFDESSTLRLTFALYVLLVLLLLSTSAASPWKAERLGFVAVAPGIAHATFQVSPGDAEPFSGHAFKIDLDVAELRLVPAGSPSSRRTVEEIVAPYPAVVAINASFFDKEGRAMGLAVDEGRPIAGGKRQSWGALVVQGIPRLVVGGKVQGLKSQFAERTAVCADGSVVILVVSTKTETVSFARFLADPSEKGGLGCVDALNLDGGPSTQLVVKLPALALLLPGGWGVPNALVVTPGKR